jgi:ABC-type polysaccharide/polyol phosphate transport system ATPase subunit
MIDIQKNRLELQDVCLSYPIVHSDSYSLKRWMSRGFDTSKNFETEFDALKNLTLTIKDGERVGLIGLNGAGKTTLLKAISGIYKPRSGIMNIHGKVSSILDFATGFEAEMTGVENIYIRGLLLGMDPDMIRQKTEDIIKFSELGDHVYQPVRTYSAGMFIRLAFATTTSIDPDILIMDEVVGAGDASFQEKAEKRLRNLITRGNVVIMSSHSMGMIEEFCNRVIWLEKGVVMADGATKDVIKAYLASVHQPLIATVQVVA